MSPILDISYREDLSGMTPLWSLEDSGYRYVLYSGNRVDVFKGDGAVPTYTVGPDGCSCPAGQYGNVCKHRKFSWVGSSAPTLNAGEVSAAGVDDLL